MFENASKHVKGALNVKKISQNRGKLFKNGWKRAPRAQTTCLLSFGPFPIVVDFCLSPYRVVCRLEAVYAKKHALESIKMNGKKTNTLTKGPNNVSGVIWAVSHRHSLPPVSILLCHPCVCPCGGCTSFSHVELVTLRIWRVGQTSHIVTFRVLPTT